jgi:hypothetical protein
MSFFVQQTATINVDDQNAVVIRKLTHGESSDITGQCMVQKFSVVGKDVQQTMELDALKYRDLGVFAAIVSWSGPGFEDRPVTLENFRALPDTVVNVISRAVDSLSGLSESEKKESPEPTS